jgi:hypothetical protein
MPPLEEELNPPPAPVVELLLTAVAELEDEELVAPPAPLVLDAVLEPCCVTVLLQPTTNETARNAVAAKRIRG